MTDLEKRRTLKLIGGTGIGAGLASSSAIASFDLLNPAETDAHSGLSAGGTVELDINIISTRALPEQSVILTNNTDDVITIDRFMPASVIFNESLVDLNSLLESGPLHIAPHQSVSSEVEVWNLLAKPVLEYVWATDAMYPLSDETDIVPVGAFLADGKAIVFPTGEPAVLVA